MNTKQKKFVDFLDNLGQKTGQTSLMEAVKEGYKACFEGAICWYDKENDLENRVETGVYAGVKGYFEWCDGWGDSEIVRKRDKAMVTAPNLEARLNAHGFTGDTWETWTQEEFDACFDEAHADKLFGHRYFTKF